MPTTDVADPFGSVEAVDAADPTPDVAVTTVASPTPIPTSTPPPSPTASPVAQASPTPTETRTDVGTEIGLASPPEDLLDGEQTGAEEGVASPEDANPGPTAPLAVFSIVEGQIVVPADEGIAPEVVADATRIWNRFANLIPADQRGDVAVFGVWEDLEGGGYVTRAADLSTWELHVTTALQGIFLDYLLLHEFGHIYTLRRGESVAIGADAPGEPCAEWFRGDGCLLEDALLDRFYERFWSPTMLEGAERLRTETDTSLFLIEYPAVFVSRYAASSPVEDFAETWVSFLTRPRPAADGTLATEKLQFLWRRDALVELREQIVPKLETLTE